MAHYNRAQLAAALRQVGVQPGDVVFSHSNVGYFGLPEEGRGSDAVCATILGAIQDVLGDDGTLVVPTFSYSFCKGEQFDPNETPSTCGAFTEYVRRQPAAIRSLDPIFSVAALGARAAELVADVSADCFGAGTFWARFLTANGVICNLNFDAGSTFIHHVERCLRVPYRFDKLFTGIFCVDGREERGAAVFFCRDGSNPDTIPAFEPFDALAREQGIARSAKVGRGAVVALRARETYRLIEEQLLEDPWFLTNSAGTGKNVELERSGADRFLVELAPQATMRQVLDALWYLPRDLLSDGYDAALNALAAQVPMEVHRYPTGTQCWSWIVPEKWTCREAYLETTGGTRLLSYAENPLHVVSYSLPFAGEVPRAELLRHLHVHPHLPDSVPFQFKYYERDWGLCCSRDFLATLTDDSYRVRIDTEFSFGSVKVGEVVAHGDTEQCFVLCAHLCHPAQANDDLSGVVVGLAVMRDLLRRNNLHYTYRFLILPEMIGSAAYLSAHAALIPKMKGGLFLEMTGVDQPAVLQLSFAGDTPIDRLLTRALRDQDPEARAVPFGAAIGNDERQFNAPGVRVPMLSLSRVLPRTAPQFPYPEYHSSRDTPAAVSDARLEASRDLVLAMIDALEADRVPVNLYPGELFCSRFGLHIDWYVDPKGREALFEVLNRADGTRTVSEIAEECGIALETARRVVALLVRKQVVAYA